MVARTTVRSDEAMMADAVAEADKPAVVDYVPASPDVLAYDVVDLMAGDRVDYGDKDPADMTNEEYVWWAYDNLMPLWAIRANVLYRTPPVLSGLEPSTAAIGGPSFPLVVSGTNFHAGSVIVFAGQDENTTFNEEDGTLSTGVNMDYWHGPDTVPVVVRNGPGGAISEPLDFTFTAAAPEMAAADPDDLEEEIEEAKDDGDVKLSRHAPHKPAPGRRR
jgi:hypothetical protein